MNQKIHKNYKFYGVFCREFPWKKHHLHCLVVGVMLNDPWYLNQRDFSSMSPIPNQPHCMGSSSHSTGPAGGSRRRDLGPSHRRMLLPFGCSIGAGPWPLTWGKTWGRSPTNQPTFPVPAKKPSVRQCWSCWEGVGFGSVLKNNIS